MARILRAERDCIVPTSRCGVSVAIQSVFILGLLRSEMAAAGRDDTIALLFSPFRAFCDFRGR